MFTDGPVTPIHLETLIDLLRDAGPKQLDGPTAALLLQPEGLPKLNPDRGQTKQAIAAGGIEQRPVQDQFYGDRTGTLVDPFGHIWHLATHVKDVSHEELATAMKQQKPADCE